MKKILFLAALAALTACNNEQIEPTHPSPKEDAQVAIAFTAPKESRAFGSGTTETWEKAVNTAILFVYNSSNTMVLRKDLTSAEIAASSSTPLQIVIPGVSVGENCKFLVVANRVILQGVNITILNETDCSSYNGIFSTVTTKARRDGGFAMSGSTEQAITSGTTAVGISLKRVVAKIEVKTATSATFASKYTGSLLINNVTISRAARQTPLRDTDSSSTGNMDFSVSQDSSQGQNLFYIFENPVLSAGSRVQLTIDATYDVDGSSSTLSDRTAVTYQVELTGASNGQILRNGSYLVNVTINGLTGADATISVTAAPWETLVTQNVELG